jgi:hypothetical protein
MAVSEKDNRKTVLALQAKLEGGRAETRALAAELNQVRTLVSDNSVEKLSGRLKEAHAQNTFLENEHLRLQTRIDEVSAEAKRRELDLQVLQLVVNEAADKLGQHTEPSLRWWKSKRTA